MSEYGLDVHWMADAARPVPRLARGGMATLVVPSCMAAGAVESSAFILRLNAEVLIANSPPDFPNAAIPSVLRDPWILEASYVAISLKRLPSWLTDILRRLAGRGGGGPLGRGVGAAEMVGLVVSERDRVEVTEGAATIVMV